MIVLRTFPAQVPIVTENGRLTQPSLQVMLTMLSAIQELQDANAALIARVEALEP